MTSCDDHRAPPDIAPTAIKLAMALGQPANVGYRVLNALRPAGAQELQAALGDANTYRRGVLHQLPAADRFGVLSEGDAGIETVDIFLNSEQAQIPVHDLVLHRNKD